MVTEIIVSIDYSADMLLKRMMVIPLETSKKFQGKILRDHQLIFFVNRILMIRIWATVIQVLTRERWKCAFKYIVKTNQRHAIDKLREYRQRCVGIFIGTLKLLVTFFQYTFQQRFTPHRNHSTIPHCQ